MEAGKELDILVAETVMGWEYLEVDYSGTEDETPRQVELEDWIEKVGIESIGPYFVDVGRDFWVYASDMWGRGWHPSEDISAAWPIAEKLGLMLIPVTVYPSEDSWRAFKKEETETWWACVSAYATMYLPVEAYRDEWGGYVGWVEKEVGVDDVAKTAPLAICLAALKAVEHEN